MFNVNDKITSSEDTEADALDVFRKAVNNGQTRLALEALVDVIDSIIDFLTSDPEEQNVEQPTPQVVASSVIEVKEEKVESLSVENSAPVKKKTKEATTSVSE